jgi:hypothetical protein
MFKISPLSQFIFTLSIFINPLFWLHLIVSSIYLVITSQDNKLDNLKKYLEAELTCETHDYYVDKIVEEYKRSVFSLPLRIDRFIMLPLWRQILRIECSIYNQTIKLDRNSPEKKNTLLMLLFAPLSLISVFIYELLVTVVQLPAVYIVESFNYLLQSMRNIVKAISSWLDKDKKEKHPQY